MVFFWERTALLTLGLLFLSSISEATYRLKCNNSTEERTTMTPSSDGVMGRYTVEWCTNINKSDKEWKLAMTYNRRNPRGCSRISPLHSLKTVHFDSNSSSINCSSVCLYTEVDLIFSAAYRLENGLNSRRSIKTITCHNISNEYPMSTFTNAQITGKEVDHRDYIQATFFMYPIPATDYNLELCPVCNDTSQEEEKEKECRDVRANCSLASTYVVECRLRGLAPGAYDLRLVQLAPWVSWDYLRHMVTQHLYFNVTSLPEAIEATAAAEGDGWRRRTLVGLGAALAGLCFGALVLYAAARLKATTGQRRQVLAYWLGLRSAVRRRPPEGHLRPAATGAGLLARPAQVSGSYTAAGSQRAVAGRGASRPLLWAGVLYAAARLKATSGQRRQVLAYWLGLRREESKTAAVTSVSAGPILLLYAREGPALEPAVAALTKLLETVAPGQLRDRSVTSPSCCIREESKPAAAPTSIGPILLLYVREGPALEPAVAALTKLLETVAPGQVYDLYSPATVAASAGCGEAWLRILATRPDTRVILLQTAALLLHSPTCTDSDSPRSTVAASAGCGEAWLRTLATRPDTRVILLQTAALLLHSLSFTDSDKDSPRLEQPLLGGRGMYRCPLAGDALLPLALRLARQTPNAPYTKYYLATLEGLETETLPFVVPFRRYVLPRNVLTLLRDLQPARSGSAQDGTTLQLADELARATTDFVDYARANPHYLEEQLILF